MFESKCQFSNWERKCFDSFFSSMFSFWNWHGASLKCHWNKCLFVKHLDLAKKVWLISIYMAISLFKNPVTENTNFVITVYIFWFMTSFFLLFSPDLCLKFQKLSPPHFGRTHKQIIVPLQSVANKCFTGSRISALMVPQRALNLLSIICIWVMLSWTHPAGHFPFPSLMAWQLNHTLFLS